MINELLRDLINMRKVKSFINNVMLEIESKEGHDKLVEEILRIEKNYLYVKPEKCKWKVREVNFLEVVIRLEGRKIEEEKNESNIVLASSKVSKRCVKIPETSKLL